MIDEFITGSLKPERDVQNNSLMPIGRCLSSAEIQTPQHPDRRSCSSNPTKSSFFRAHSRLYVAFYAEKQAQKMAQHSLKVKYIIVPMASALIGQDDVNMQTDCGAPSSLIDIYKFHEMTSQIARRDADHKLVFSAGPSVNGQIKVVFLIGCHMIMSRCLDAEKTYDVFRSFEEFFVDLGSSQVNILDCWRALHRSTCLGWIDFRERFDAEREQDQTIDMEEFIHYSRSVTFGCNSTYFLPVQVHQLRGYLPV